MIKIITLRNTLLVILLISSIILSATTNYYFYIQFANKNKSPYSLSTPSDFLSARAISRREHRAPTYDSTDLPINPSYLSQIENLGIHLHNRSKWMNGATALLADSSQMSLVRALPFVKSVQYTGKVNVSAPVSPQRVSSQSNFDYGVANTQINQLTGQYLHNLGYRGKDVMIGILDAGFTNVNINPAFDSLRLQGRLLGTKDIIEPLSNIYAQDTHGANVLSAMAGNLPGQFLGTAPDASFWLIRTEYAPTEYLVETDFWCSGIEFADSVGVDVVNSSLIYTTFDDPTMNFTYADMNGKVSRASRAANLAASKGIVVLNSAGNDGAKAWHYIGSPADAEGIVTVGSVQSDGVSSSFSSFGPSSDGRIKPEISSLGTSAAVVNSLGTPIFRNGTSYASPIMAGMMACLLQERSIDQPYFNISSVLQAVFQTGNLYANPTAQKGYGIPNFQQALGTLIATNRQLLVDNDDFILINNALDKSIIVKIKDPAKTKKAMIRMYALTGVVVANQLVCETETVFHTNDFAPGVYAVCFYGDERTITQKVIIK
jgi:serine protease AprX